jgi:hypothetical protein
MIARLKREWGEPNSFEAPVELCASLDAMLHQIRSERHISSPIFTYGTRQLEVPNEYTRKASAVALEVVEARNLPKAVMARLGRIEANLIGERTSPVLRKLALTRGDGAGRRGVDQTPSPNRPLFDDDGNAVFRLESEGRAKFKLKAGR